LFAPLVLAASLTLKVDPHVAATFDPERALGATIDAHSRDETHALFTPANTAAMLSAGFHPLSYRLATELDGEAWHWNPNGRWSDETREQGYWTSDDHSSKPIDVSYGYRLPRRGNTHDQMHNDDWSRIDDGDPATFWKSNPYLDDGTFTRPQWVLIDLGAPHTPDAVRIDWADPYAVDYDVQYWSGSDAINMPAAGSWLTFPHGAIRNAHGGPLSHDLGAPPAPVRFLRIWMTTSSHTPGHGPRANRDARDRAGFAVAELSITEQGRELVRHAESADLQTVIWVSSTDPWHRASDQDDDVEQPGLDLVYSLGLTRGLPMLTPVALLYGTPEDAAAEVRYLRRRKRHVTMIELGEEPDGQNMAPEDYAALYVKWSDAIHAVDPALRLGGPAFQSTRDFVAFWPDEHGQTAWMGRFVAALRASHHLGAFNFFSFEWYPFDDVCGDPRKQLLEAPALLTGVLSRWRSEGVPSSIPWLATEYGWSSWGAPAEVDIPGALFNAEFLADFLAAGGAGAWFYGLEPEALIHEHCDAWGNLVLFLSDRKHHIRAPVPAFYGAQLLTRTWLAPRGPHELHRVDGTNGTLRAWAVRRPDGRWSWLLINKGETPQHVRLAGEVTQYSRLDYVWESDGADGHPTINRPPRHFTAKGELELPPLSMTVCSAPKQR
jgi:hypothetical protein